ncbi:restriction endonuclease subunit S [Aeromonas mytilicola]|uniref:restriction endonuclease subunit S n=1 Tax=Aeromonas media TaxID=651 RepID=UPI0022807071|nr:restriction endonuclease subunit S [Aeromonas media]MCY9835179.1 restriction endonuclease subunit S [Aeromonas media]
MSSEWPLVRLEEITSVLGDGLHGTPIYDDGGDYHFINGNNLLEGRIVINEKTKRVTEAEAHKHRKNLNERTILVSINGTLGNIAFYCGERVILGKSACYFNVDTGVDKHFVRYVLQSDTFQNYIHNLATGSTIKNVSLRLMRDFSFQLPPFEVQERISATLKALDDRIALLRETNATLEAIVQALFKSWFVDFDPVHARARGEEPAGLSPEVAALFPNSFEESELGMIPKGWRVGELGQEVRISYGKNLPTTKLLDAGFPVYGGNGQIGFFDSYLYKDRQVLVACRGAASGKVNQSVPEAFITNNSLVLESTELLTFSYLKGFMTRADLTPYVTGSAQPQVTIDNLKNFKILVPPQPMVAHYEAFAGLIENRIEGNCLQAQSLATLRDTLLPRLISGQLRLPEAEAMVEAVS